MSESKRFKKDCSLDGWPDNKAVLNADDLLVILNRFDEMERSINKLKAEAVIEAAYKNRRSMVEGGDKWLCSVDDLVEHANGIERGEL